LDAAAATIALIEARPEIGAVVSRAGLTRRASVHRFPYQVVYHLAAREIVIVAFAHLKRRPGYWKKRR
jgi:plasmid stabilization system protein ParE